MRVRATLLDSKAVVDAQVNAGKKTVVLLAAKDDLNERKVTEMMKRKGFQVTSFKVEQLGQVGG